MKRLYRPLNVLFHCVHGAIMILILVGWTIPAARLLHLVVTLLTLASWFILGIWLGPGYCPLTSWHWALKESLGTGRPDKTYIQLVGETILRRTLDGPTVDRLAVLTTIGVAAASLILNLGRFV